MALCEVQEQQQQTDKQQRIMSGGSMHALPLPGFWKSKVMTSVSA